LKRVMLRMTVKKNAKLLEMHSIAKGHVQGVGFRYTTQKLALQLQLTGFVRNLPDGTVEICAQGPQENLEKLISALKKEFALSEETLLSEFCPSKNVYSEFTIVK
jgi:acylphosphatase